MSTRPFPLADHAWTLVCAGPTTAPVSAEVEASLGTVWLAISADIPAYIATGHRLTPGQVKLIELDAGENLYAYAAPYQNPCSLIFTD